MGSDSFCVTDLTALWVALRVRPQHRVATADRRRRAESEQCIFKFIYFLCSRKKNKKHAEEKRQIRELCCGVAEETEMSLFIFLFKKCVFKNIAAVKTLT